MSASTSVDASAPKAAATVPVAAEQSTEGNTPFVTINIVAPDGSRLPVDVMPNEVIAELRQQICESPSTAFFTWFSLENSAGERIDEMHDIKSLGENATIHIVPLEYDVRSLNNHVQAFRELVQNPPKVGSSSWMTALQESNSREMPKVEPKLKLDFNELARDLQPQPQSCEPVDISSLSVVYSPFNPPPSHRRLQGDVAYLHVTTPEGTPLSVTVNGASLYVSGSGHVAPQPVDVDNGGGSGASTLCELLVSCSVGFLHWYQRLLAASPSPLHPLHHVQPLLGVAQNCLHLQKPREASSDASALERFLQNSQPHATDRVWNDERAQCLLVDATKPEGKYNRDRALHLVYAEFVAASRDAVSAIHEGVCVPLNPNEPSHSHVFVYSSIFVSFGDKDEAAWKNASHDLNSVAAFESAEVDGIHNLMTCLIDLRGRRYICQAVIPGILNGTSQDALLYGALENGERVDENAEFKSELQKIAATLHIGDRDAVDDNGNEIRVASSTDLKGIRGSDGHMYALDLRSSPRDANYPELSSARLRREFIEAECASRAVQSVVDSTNDVDSLPTFESEGKLFVSMQELSRRLQFNINVFTSSESRASSQFDADRKAVQELADSLGTETIAKLVETMLAPDTPLPMDSRSLSAYLHARGVNMRYLGAVAEKVRGKSASLYELCVGEMTMRALKALLRARLRSAPYSQTASCISAFLNEMVQASEPVQQLADEIQRKFRFASSGLVSSARKFSVLRSLLLRCGIRVRADAVAEAVANDQFRFVEDDIVDLFAVTKAFLPFGAEVNQVVSVARSQLANGQVQVGFDMLLELLLLMQHILGPVDYRTASVHSSIAMLCFRLGKAEVALDHQMRALTIAQKCLPIDDPETASYHSAFSLYLLAVGLNVLALEHAERAREIIELLCGANHRETAAAIMNIGVVFFQSGSLEAAETFFTEALARFEAAEDELLQAANVLHSLALCSSKAGEWRAAMAHEKRALNLLLEKFGGDDARTQAHKQWLSWFTQSAVLTLKKEVVDADKAPGRFTPTWIAPAALPSMQLFLCKTIAPEMLLMVKDIAPASAPVPAPAPVASAVPVLESAPPATKEKMSVTTPTPGVSGGDLVSAVASPDSAPEPALEQPDEPGKKQKRTGGRKARKGKKGKKNHRS